MKLNKKALLVLAGLMITASVSACSKSDISEDGTFTPSDTINWTVTSSPGGGSDIFTRKIGDIMTTEDMINGQTIIVTNKTDGGGEIGDYEDVEVPVWRGVVASPEMDDAAVAFYSEALKKVSETEAWKTEYLDRNMLISNYMDAAAATEYMTQFEADYLASLEAAE